MSEGLDINPSFDTMRTKSQIVVSLRGIAHFTSSGGFDSDSFVMWLISIQIAYNSNPGLELMVQIK